MTLKFLDMLPTEMIDRMQLLSGEDSGNEVAARPGSSRIGSARFQVLPPIPAEEPKAGLAQ